ncbi:alpha/beta fold hydrolase [Acidovorax sp. BL-A-41-H1]|uniref:alpha/beta fold hydrolase n=1 Tax=Acidovorax sp. BL-A-41-H1 TaxID=3421102 RepID=UPI003F78EE61
MSESSGFATIDWRGRPVVIEYERIAATGEATDAASSAALHGPLVVFLHEGLGSVAMWKDFPRRLCHAGGFRGLVYSRPGYGRSTPRAADETWGVDFMHRQAHEVLPALLTVLGIDDVPWLFGHSDGASIALLHAAKFPQRVRGLVLLAPHVFVEDITVQNIAEARQAYETAGLRDRLARYHDDVDSAFGGWSRIWLDPAFRAWNLMLEMAAVQAPVLAVQGLGDEYGTLEQVRTIARDVPRTTLLELPACGHSPHRDRPDDVIAATLAFMRAAGPA